MLLSVSAIYASASAFLILYVSYRVVDFNNGVKLATGYRADVAGDAPLMLLLIVLAELNDASHILMHSIGILFFSYQLARSIAFLKVLGRYATEHAAYTVINRGILVILALLNLALALGLKA